MSAGDWDVKDRHKYLKRLFMLMPSWMCLLIMKFCAADCENCIFKPKGTLEMGKCSGGMVCRYKGDIAMLCVNFKKKINKEQRYGKKKGL